MSTTIDGRVVGIPDGALPKAAGDLTVFRFIGDADVPEFKRHLARKIADRAARELDIDRVGLRWFRYERSYPDRGEGDGWFDGTPYYRAGSNIYEASIESVRVPGFCARASEAGEMICGATHRGDTAIGILEGLEGQLLTCAIGHEARHLWQFQHDRAHHLEAMEADAFAWGGRFALRQEPYIARLTRRAA